MPKRTFTLTIPAAARTPALTGAGAQRSLYKVLRRAFETRQRLSEGPRKDKRISSTAFPTLGNRFPTSRLSGFVLPAISSHVDDVDVFL